MRVRPDAGARWSHNSRRAWRSDMRRVRSWNSPAAGLRASPLTSARARGRARRECSQPTAEPGSALEPRRRRLTGHPSRCDRACSKGISPGPKSLGAEGRLRRVRPRLLVVLVVAVHWRHSPGTTTSAPLALVLAGLVIGSCRPPRHRPRSGVVLVLLPPLLWSAGLEAHYVNMRRNKRSIAMLSRWACPQLPRRPSLRRPVRSDCQLTLAAALTLGAIVAPPDAVSANAIGRAGPAARIADVDRRREPAQRRGAHRLQAGAGCGDRRGSQLAARAGETSGLAVAGGVVVEARHAERSHRCTCGGDLDDATQSGKCRSA